jgi:hypothetical protein
MLKALQRLQQVHCALQRPTCGDVEATHFLYSLLDAQQLQKATKSYYQRFRLFTGLRQVLCTCEGAEGKWAT